MQLFAALSNPLGLTLLSVALVVFTAALLALFVAWWNEEFPPLRAKNLGLTSIALFGSILFFAGLVHASGIFAAHTGVAALAYCGLWEVWLQLVFGLGLLNLALHIRLYTLYHAFRLRKQPTSFKRVLPALLLWLPWLAFGFVAFWSPNSSVRLDPASNTCVTNVWWRVVVVSWLGVALLVMLALSITLRGIRGLVAEYRESLVGMAAALIAVGSLAAVSFAPVAKSIVGTAAILFVNLVALNAYFYTVLGGVLFGTVFHRDHTLKEFILDMQQEGAGYQMQQQMQQQQQQRASQQSGSLETPYKQMMRKQSGVGAMGLGMSIGTPELNY